MKTSLVIVAMIFCAASRANKAADYLLAFVRCDEAKRMAA